MKTMADTTPEGTVEDRERYLNHVYPVVECTFSLWRGRTRHPVETPVRYTNMTREQALMALVSALHTGDPQVNRFKQGYSDLHTRGIEE